MDRRTVLSLFAMAAVKGSVPIRGSAARTVDLTTASIADLGGALTAGALSSERLTALYWPASPPTQGRSAH